MQPEFLIALFVGLMASLAVLVVWEFRRSRRDFSWRRVEVEVFNKPRYQPPTDRVRQDRAL